MRIARTQNPAGLVITLLCGLFIGSAHAQANSDIAAPASDASPANRYATEGWRTFAKPLALGSSGLLLFQRYFGGAVVRHIDWNTQNTSSFELPELTLYTNKEIRYTALSSRDGLWLLGETSMLIRPNGQRLILRTKFDEPVAVALSDQSILVLGESSHGKEGDPKRLSQLRITKAGDRLEIVDRGWLSHDSKPNKAGQIYRVPGYGHSAVKLPDGRVLMLGGGNTSTLASLIEPSTKAGSWAVTPVAALPNPRVFGAALLLPDGRVAVTGAPHLSCHGETQQKHTVDVYDVQGDNWSSLPPLPFVPCADAYGADRPSFALTSNNSLVVGAHLEPHVMVLARDAKSPTGYANSWQVHGRMPLRRISGVVQALSDQEVIVAGGVDNVRREFGGCCYPTAGFDRIDIAQTESTESLAMSLIGAGVAKRGQWLFAASGRRFGFTGSGQMRYSAHAEMIDLSTGKARQLPNVPFASGAAQAFWLDDDRVLLKGIKASNDRGFDAGENLSSYMPPSSSAMAIFHMKDKRWSEPIALSELEQAQIIVAEGDKVLLLSAPQQVLRLDLFTRKLEVVQQTQRGRLGGTARLLPHGKLVLAGGQVQSETVSVLDPDCEATPGKACPERFTGYGRYDSVAMIETLLLESSAPTAASTLSRTASGKAASTVVTPQGGAIVLIRDPENEQLSMARSSENGQSWDTIPLPLDLTNVRNDHCGSCTLLLAPDPRNPDNALVFLRRGAVDADYVDDAIEAQSVDVWWWDDAGKNWHKVLRSKGMAARSHPLALGDPLSPKQGKRMMSMGWHLREPVLWMEQ